MVDATTARRSWRPCSASDKGVGITASATAMAFSPCNALLSAQKFFPVRCAQRHGPEARAAFEGAMFSHQHKGRPRDVEQVLGQGEEGRTCNRIGRAGMRAACNQPPTPSTPPSDPPAFMRKRTYSRLGSAALRSIVPAGN